MFKGTPAKENFKLGFMQMCLLSAEARTRKYVQFPCQEDGGDHFMNLKPIIPKSAHHSKRQNIGNEENMCLTTERLYDTSLQIT